MFPHVGCRGRWGVAVKVYAGVYALTGEIKLRIAKASDAAHLGIDHPLYQGGGHCCVDGVAACAQHPSASFGRFGLCGDDHCLRVLSHIVLLLFWAGAAVLVPASATTSAITRIAIMLTISAIAMDDLVVSGQERFQVILHHQILRQCRKDSIRQRLGFGRLRPRVPRWGESHRQLHLRLSFVHTPTR